MIRNRSVSNIGIYFLQVDVFKIRASRDSRINQVQAHETGNKSSLILMRNQTIIEAPRTLVIPITDRTNRSRMERNSTITTTLMDRREIKNRNGFITRNKTGIAKNIPAIRKDHPVPDLIIPNGTTTTTTKMETRIFYHNQDTEIKTGTME